MRRRAHSASLSFPHTVKNTNCDMANKSPKTYLPTTLEKSSILRKFTILFLIMSFVPTCVLYYFYAQFKYRGSLQITEADFNLTLTFIVLGVILVYFSMKSVLQQLVDLTNA